MGLRRKSRECALQFLFRHEFQQLPCDPDTIESQLRDFQEHFEVSKKTLPYAAGLLSGICSRWEEIDTLVATHSQHWRIERMSVVDRNILRIAVYEMRFSGEVPSQVAINEALEIAKRYSTEDSVSFLNGILDAIGANGTTRI